MEAQETSECSNKRMKMGDLESGSRSEAQEWRGGNMSTCLDANPDSTTLDLNVKVGAVKSMLGDDATACIKESSQLPTSGNEENECNDGFVKSKGFDLDLNVDDISSSIKNDPFYPHKSYELLKPRDDSESGSSIGPLDEKDSLRRWIESKQNGYMSASYKAWPTSMTMPKPRGRKSKNDGLKRKIEIAKKEQSERFAKVAAPSGLLNELNPGIINHVRNSKQVHSIIEALVKLARTENQHSGNKKLNQTESGVINVNCSGVNGFGLNSGENKPMRDYPLFSKSFSLNSEVTRGDDNSCMRETRTFARMPLQCNFENKDDALALRLSSSVTNASENTSSLSNEESANCTGVNSLSVTAANVASQWLELLNQDTKGRLAALRRSKKRVQAVIQTELPFLMSREFSSNQEKDSYSTKESFFCDRESAEAHSVRWSTLFQQMNKALSEEESHLESWLKQVKAMQSHCERGLYGSSLHHSSQQTDPLGNDIRLGGADNSEKDLAIRAAAASIYSTCNFLLSKENHPSC